MAYKRQKGVSLSKKSKKKRNLNFNGTEYKSGLELTMAKLLVEAKIKFKYEPKSFDLIETFNFPFRCYERQGNGKGDMVDRGCKKVRGITYTPDFVGEDFIIETKGYANESFPIRWKLFKKMLIDRGVADPDKLIIYKPQKISECEEVVKLIKHHRDGK